MSTKLPQGILYGSSSDREGIQDEEVATTMRSDQPATDAPTEKPQPFERYRKQWKLVRREAAAGSRVSAVVSLAMLTAMLEANAIGADSKPPGLPRWLVDDIREVFMQAIRDGTGLDEGFHLTRKAGRNLMDNASRDMEIALLIPHFESWEHLADHAEELGVPPPKLGEVWTADALAKAAAAHQRRINSGLLIHGKED